LGPARRGETPPGDCHQRSFPRRSDQRAPVRYAADACSPASRRVPVAAPARGEGPRLASNLQPSRPDAVYPRTRSDRLALCDARARPRNEGDRSPSPRRRGPARGCGLHRRPTRRGPRRRRRRHEPVTGHTADRSLDRSEAIQRHAEGRALPERGARRNGGYRCHGGCASERTTRRSRAGRDRSGAFARGPSAVGPAQRHHHPTLLRRGRQLRPGSGAIFLANLRRYVLGEPLESVVDKEAGY
jgi:hypothetical protein